MAEERTFTREEFFNLVWAKPMQQLGKEFGRSDVGLAKICKSWLIPRPPRGYWQQLGAGRSPKQPTLPAISPNASPVIRFWIPETGAQTDAVTPPEVGSWIEREGELANRIEVQTTVHKYHPLVKRTKEELESHGENHRGLRWARDAGLRLTVGAQSIHRACRFLHALFTAIEARGWRVERPSLDYHTAIVHVLDETIDLTFEERSNRRPHELTPDEERRSRRGEAIYPAKWDYIPSGVFRLTVSHGATKRTFADRKNDVVEAHLNEIIVAIVRTAIENARPWRVLCEEEERHRMKAEEERRVFEERRTRFEAAFQAFKEHEERLQFVGLLESSLSLQESVGEAAREFVAWTRSYIAASEPLPRFLEALVNNKAAGYRQFTAELPRQWW